MIGTFVIVEDGGFSIGSGIAVITISGVSVATTTGVNGANVIGETVGDEEIGVTGSSGTVGGRAID